MNRGKSSASFVTSAVTSIAAALCMTSVIVGCGGDALVEMSAADAFHSVADQMELTVREYHDEVIRSDDALEAAVVDAFVERVKSDVEDDTAMQTHESQFKSALAKIRADRETEWSRRTAAMDNVGALREVSDGLQRMAVESLSLQDEFRRYLSGWLEAQRRTQTVTTNHTPSNNNTR